MPISPMHKNVVHSLSPLLKLIRIEKYVKFVALYFALLFMIT